MARSKETKTSGKSEITVRGKAAPPAAKTVVVAGTGKVAEYHIPPSADQDEE